jgi:steroid delta-isomerase-like uncharacterized protein
MDIIDRHFAAENNHDVAGALATYTADVIWDDVSDPRCPLSGHEAAGANYENIMRTLPDLRLESVFRFTCHDHVVDESILTGTVNGSYLGVECHGAPVRFRILHVFDLRDGLIAREQAWFDTNTVVEELKRYVKSNIAAGERQPEGDIR